MGSATLGVVLTPSAGDESADPYQWDQLWNSILYTHGIAIHTIGNSKPSPRQKLDLCAVHLSKRITDQAHTGAER